MTNALRILVAIALVLALLYARPRAQDYYRGTTTVRLSPQAFVTLGTPADGLLMFCIDCAITNPCAGGGTGAIAKRLNGLWICN